MNCPKCNTWNPEDKTYCWRCQAELPKPVQKTKREQRMLFGLPMWMWLAIVLFFAVMLLGQCVLLGAPA